MPRTSVVRQNGPAIRELRVAAGLDTVQFAKRVRCHPDYVSMFELGHKEQIGEALFNRICRVLAVTDKDRLRSSKAAA